MARGGMQAWYSSDERNRESKRKRGMTLLSCRVAQPVVRSRR
jgi:hypothetical protein